jgi:hypothetical protein
MIGRIAIRIAAVSCVQRVPNGPWNESSPMGTVRACSELITSSRMLKNSATR